MGHTNRAERAYPPQGRMVEVGDATRHCVRAGPDEPVGPTVVLIHGAFASVFDFTLAERFWIDLTAKYPSVAVDRPGKGYSQRPPGLTVTPQDEAATVQRLIEVLELERPVVLAHSSGCAVALAHAVAFPDAARGYVLLAPSVYPPSEEEQGRFWPLRILEVPCVGPLLMGVAVRGAGSWLAPRLVRQSFAPNTVPLAFERFNAALPRRPAQVHREFRDLRAYPDSLNRLLPQLPRVRSPVQIVVGEEDPLAPPEQQGRRVAKTLPHAELVTLPKTGHMVHVVRPQAVMDAIERLVAQSAPLSQ